jgi:hypothetical protein
LLPLAASKENSQMHLKRRSLCQSNNRKSPKPTVKLALLSTGIIDTAKIMIRIEKGLKRKIGRFTLIYQSLPMIVVNT